MVIGGGALIVLEELFDCLSVLVLPTVENEGECGNALGPHEWVASCNVSVNAWFE